MMVFPWCWVRGKSLDELWGSIVRLIDVWKLQMAVLDGFNGLVGLVGIFSQRVRTGDFARLRCEDVDFRAASGFLEQGCDVVVVGGFDRGFIVEDGLRDGGAVVGDLEAVGVEGEVLFMASGVVDLGGLVVELLAFEADGAEDAFKSGLLEGVEVVDGC